MAAIKPRSATCFDSADYKEGRTAFMEKRAPAVPGSIISSDAQFRGPASPGVIPNAARNAAPKAGPLL